MLWLLQRRSWLWLKERSHLCMYAWETSNIWMVLSAGEIQRWAMSQNLQTTVSPCLSKKTVFILLLKNSYLTKSTGLNQSLNATRELMIMTEAPKISNVNRWSTSGLQRQAKNTPALWRLSMYLNPKKLVNLVQWIALCFWCYQKNIHHSISTNM